MSGAIPPLPQYAFMAWCLVKSTGTSLPLPYLIYQMEEYSVLKLKSKSVSLIVEFRMSSGGD
jgi:hypothetical protein